MRTRYNQEQIIELLKEANTGATASDVCRKHGISESTFYRWKSKFGGNSWAAFGKRLKKLECENAKLKRLLAEVYLKNATLKERLSENR